MMIPLERLWYSGFSYSDYQVRIMKLKGKYNCQNSPELALINSLFSVSNYREMNNEFWYCIVLVIIINLKLNSHLQGFLIKYEVVIRNYSFSFLQWLSWIELFYPTGAHLKASVIYILISEVEKQRH